MRCVSRTGSQCAITSMSCERLNAGPREGGAHVQLELEEGMKPIGYRSRVITLAAMLSTAVALGGVAYAQDFAKVNASRLVNAQKDPSNWITHGGNYAETHYSALDQINASNVGKLNLAWFADFDTNRGQQATPLVIDGVMYTSTSWSKVYAYDAATGKELWRFDPKVPGTIAKSVCCDVVNRGVAAWNGKIYVATLDGRLIAVDARTGKPVWSTVTVDQAKPYTITGAPRVANGKVYIGNGGAEYGVRGYVTAYDAETGKQSWRFYITPNPENKPDGAASDKILMEKAYGTWGDGAWKQTGGGGTAWDAIVYDPDFNQVIIGTGNANPWSWKSRSGNQGDNLFIGSMLAVDADTGAYRWHYQETPGDDWDYTSVQPIILTDLDINGAKKKVALHAPKNGFFYVVDRSNGRLISAEKFATVNWAAGVDMETGKPVVYEQARYGITGGDFLAIPGPFGAHNWHPMAFSPKTNLVYIPVQNIPFGYADNGSFKYTPGHGAWNLGITSTQNGGPQDEPERKIQAMRTEGHLVAWDPIRQTEVWRVNHGGVASAGVLATGGNLVFQGTPDGKLIAYRADNGQKVWSWQGFEGIVAGAMSYMVKGEQYIAVLAGFGGSNALHVPYFKSVRIGTNGRVLVFKLNGKATLPDNTKPVLDAQVPSDTFTDAQVAHGASLYGNCVLCHGFGMNTNNMIPDLRRSPIPSNRAAWEDVVLRGSREDKGMPKWSETLSAEDSEALRAYVASRAKVLKRDLDAERAVARK
jgi:PQQ-dependent dehydrogenase (methanol/ethanol family)